MSWMELELKILIPVYLMPNSLSSMLVNKHLPTTHYVAEEPSLHTSEPFIESYCASDAHITTWGHLAQTTDLYRKGGGRKVKKKTCPSPQVSSSSPRTEDARTREPPLTSSETHHLIFSGGPGVRKPHCSPPLT